MLDCFYEMLHVLRNIRNFASHTETQAECSLMQSQWWSGEQIRAYQLKQLDDLCQHCVQNVPYYREQWAQLGSFANPLTWQAFLQLPILQRSFYHEHRAKFLAEQLPEGSWLTGVGRTSGSTGIPIEIQRTNVTEEAWNANALRELAWTGIDCSGTLAAIRYQVGPTGQLALASWGPPYDSLMQTGPAYGLTIASPIAQQRAWLKQVDPHVILTTASNLGGLFLAEGDFPSLGKLQAIRCIGGENSPELRSQIETQCGVPVWDVYSCEEAGFLAVQCEQREQYHVQAESVLLEVLDQHDQPCQPGETGRVVITTLNNYANPLIRYALGDLATVGHACRCGRGLPTLSRISGRQRPPFQLPVGGWKNSQLLSEQFARVRGLAQFQCIQQDAASVLVRLVPGREWTSQTQSEVAQIVDGFFELTHGVSFHLQWEVCQRIEPDATGKYHPFVTRCSSDSKSPPQSAAGH